MEQQSDASFRLFKEREDCDSLGVIAVSDAGNVMCGVFYGGDVSIGPESIIVSSIAKHEAPIAKCEASITKREASIAKHEASFVPLLFRRICLLPWLWQQV